jgi:hypothetical protein
MAFRNLDESPFQPVNPQEKFAEGAHLYHLLLLPNFSAERRILTHKIARHADHSFSPIDTEEQWVIESHYVPDSNSLSLAVKSGDQKIVASSTKCRVHRRPFAELNGKEMLPEQCAGTKETNPVESSAEYCSRRGLPKHLSKQPFHCFIFFPSDLDLT